MKRYLVKILVLILVLPAIFYAPGSLLFSLVLGFGLLVIGGITYFRTELRGERIFLFCVPIVLVVELWVMYAVLPQGGLRQNIRPVNIVDMYAPEFIAHLRREIQMPIEILGNDFMILSEENVKALPNVTLLCDAERVEGLMDCIRSQLGWDCYARMGSNPFLASLSGYWDVICIVLCPYAGSSNSVPGNSSESDVKIPNA